MLGKIKITFTSVIVGLFLLLFFLFIIIEMGHISWAVTEGPGVDFPRLLGRFHDRVGSALLHVFQYSAHKLFIIVEIFKNPEIYNYPRLGSDNLSAVLLTLPGVNTSNTGLYILPEVISQKIMGKDNGSIPPGWIGWALLNGGYCWLFLKMIVAAYLGATLDKSKVNFINSLGDKLGAYFYFILVLFLYWVLFASGATNLLRSKIGLVIFLMLLCILPFVRVIKIRLIRH